MGNFYSGRFDGIQAMRALAAFSVLVNHMAFALNGGFGVDIFFCISGFIMMYVTEKSTEQFFLKRIIRIFPLYYIITILTYAGSYIVPQLFEKTDMNPLYLIKSLLFIPFDIGGKIQPIVRVGWTLNYEMFFYLILWLSMHISRRYRGLIAGVIILSITVAGHILTFCNVPAAEYDIIAFWSDSIMIEFIYGMAAYMILRRISDSIHIVKNVKIIMLLAATACYIFMCSVKYIDIYDNVPRFIIFGIPAFILFNMVFIVTYGKKLPKIPVLLGDISYSVYLIHYPVVRLYNHYMCPDGNPDVVAIMGAVITTTIVIVVSYISYNIIELKVSKLLRQFFPSLH